VKRHPLLLVAEPPRIKATPFTVQGTLAKRQMMPKEGGGFLQVADLAVGKNVRVYGRCGQPQPCLLCAADHQSQGSS
jgi:hypothetical protein